MCIMHCISAQNTHTKRNDVHIIHAACEKPIHAHTNIILHNFCSCCSFRMHCCAPGIMHSVLFVCLIRAHYCVHCCAVRLLSCHRRRHRRRRYRPTSARAHQGLFRNKVAAFLNVPWTFYSLASRWLAVEIMQSCWKQSAAESCTTRHPDTCTHSTRKSHYLCSMYSIRLRAVFLCVVCM